MLIWTHMVKKGCNKECADKCYLSTHMKIHSNELKYPCRKCKKRFRFYEQCKWHVWYLNWCQCHQGHSQSQGCRTISLICISLLYNNPILRDCSELTSRQLACMPTDVFSLSINSHIVTYTMPCTLLRDSQKCQICLIYENLDWAEAKVT